MPFYRIAVEDGCAAAGELCVEFPDLAAARMEATLFAGQLLHDQPDKFWNGPAWTVTLTDETGAPLLIITLAGQICAAAAGQLNATG